MLVGPEACAIPLDAPDVPVIRVRAESIVPLDDDLSAVVGYAADGTFTGPDADRWRTLSGPSVRGDTAMLWAAAQVQAASLQQSTLGWERVLVVAFADDPGLVPAVRAVVDAERAVTVLVGGEVPSEQAAPLPADRAAHVQTAVTVLAHLVRQGHVATVIWNPNPADVIDVALDAARHPDPIKVPRAQPLDIGPLLDLPSTWNVPASPVHFFALVHVPMGYARTLPELVVMVAAWRALREALGGPPLDLAQVKGREERRGVDPDLHQRVGEKVKEAFEQVRLDGDELLVEQMERHLRPVHGMVERALEQIADQERNRLRHLRVFTAVGIHYVVQSLSQRLDHIEDPYPTSHVEAARALTTGLAGDEVGDRVPITAWRKVFAGLPSRVVRPNVPGWQLARQLVKDRVQLLRIELSTGFTNHLEVLVRRACNTDAEPSSDELRGLLDRAERVRSALNDALEHLEQRIRAEAEEALRNDRFVRWTAGDANTLFQLLVQRVATLPVAREVEQRMVEVLSRRAFGMADERDFGRYLAEIAQQVHGITDPVARPTYENALLLLLQGRDPPVLRQAIAQSQGAEVELHLERPVEPALMNWFTATGMLVVVAPRLKTCAIYWQRVDGLDSERGRRLRRPTTEHRLADLTLPRAVGDTAPDLANLVRSAVYVVVGLVLGALGVRRSGETLQVHVVQGLDLDLPEHALLPFGALYLLASEDDLRDRLRRRIEERTQALPLRADAVETVRKLVELATLGPSATLAAQIGLSGPRFDALEQPVSAVLQRHANLAIGALVDVLHSSDLEQLLRTPRRRTLVDLQQLLPTGIA